MGTRVEAGSLLALDVELTTPVPVSYIAVDVPLPAGVEPVLLGLEGNLSHFPIKSHADPKDQFVSHAEMGRDRVVLFADQVMPGTHHYTAYVRATTPGHYSFPAAQAAAQYAPEIQAWSDEGRLTVVPAKN